ncbi:restriction endonuclease subunit R [Aliifodinibius salipaludis]|uniref:Type I restriction enzyme endonuclease subunit n=1 Tax=Fodinibius salipaludis TaxID=2032627 RepID=A0A2A2GEF9_9BACT|nr:HsdR family type I site-specific deoxyribonuclease [Aliifodinibius salipaludis]PAU95374.1 restriction endonuclease subunit R [Aliifodinibius salipaludis]
MSDVGQIERNAQNRIVKLFQERLDYDYLGNWEERENNRNVEEELLRRFLNRQGYDKPLIDKAIFELERAAQSQADSLYNTNKEVYRLLRYGTEVRASQGENKQTVHFIDWQDPLNNDFAIAEEVSVLGEFDKRPDIVLYVNGIAVGILELKRSKVSVNKGIRQNLDNQKPEFIKSFFNTIQLVMAGNDTAGLRYGTIETPEKYYQKWKEETDEEFDYLLDKHLVQLCNKERLIELIHDFVLFDAGAKKICRPHQYFGVKASQENVTKREDGIIWHTQGSGKSLTMVWLAQWIREHVDDSRVLVITDRIELDKQIVRVFDDAGESMERAESGSDLIDKLNKNEYPLISSLVHKFGTKDEGEYESYIKEIRQNLPKDFKAKGDIYVFVDECHRTQSGKLHRAMKTILPDAMFIGFTGTPLLKNDKKTSLEVFGPYIHTYKFDEAVEDNVVLDLRYEARDIDQKITDQESIDEWFEKETEGLNDVAREELMKRWGTMKKLLSSKDRLQKIVYDIVKDFKIKDRLCTGQGNALLVANSIYDACKFYELFQEHELGKYCAIVTSYNPSIDKVKGESTGAGDTEELHKYKVYQDMLDGKSTEQFEEDVKKKFVNEPAQMKLLIVVDKLLTGFDAPPATYLYIDKPMQDHGLFQAICRVNRLHTEDKEYGYVVDYKDLFKSLEQSIADYTSEAFEGYDKDDVEGLLKDRYEQARNKLDEALDAVEALCEPIHPKTTKEFIRYFCGDPENEDDLKETEEQRTTLYKLTASLIRAYTDIANEMLRAGYTKQEAIEIKQQVQFYSDVRDEVKHASGDYIDLKTYEPGMRQLIDMYISAEPSEKISALDDLSLIELVVQRGEDAVNELPEGIRNDPEAVAETIENNIRKRIIEERPTNPKYFEKMSDILEELILKRKQQALDYKKYLQELVELTKKVKQLNGQDYPEQIKTSGQKALYDNLNNDDELAKVVDKTVKYTAKDGWRDNKIKEREVKRAIKQKLPEKFNVQEVLDVIKNQDEY